LASLVKIFSAVAIELWRKPVVIVTTRIFFGSAALTVSAAQIKNQSDARINVRKVVFMVPDLLL
jgi:hypothetical protein